MEDSIKPTDLKVGDVFLYCKTDLVADMIKAFDGSEYSHAGIYYDGGVLEAIDEGVKKRSIKESVKKAKYVDVFRFTSLDGHETIGGDSYPAQPLINCMKEYEDIGERYAYEQIILLAFLATIRKVKVPIASWILRTFLDNAMSILSKIMAAGKEPMICSELVYRCFDGAGDKYRLTIRGADTVYLSLPDIPVDTGNDIQAHNLGESIVDSESQLIEDFFANYAVARHRIDKKRISEVSQAPFSVAKSFAVADFVTPKDLKYSPNLQRVGTLML